METNAGVFIEKNHSHSTKKNSKLHSRSQKDLKIYKDNIMLWISSSMLMGCKITSTEHYTLHKLYVGDIGIVFLHAYMFGPHILLETGQDNSITCTSVAVIIVFLVSESLTQPVLSIIVIYNNRGNRRQSLKCV